MPLEYSPCCDQIRFEQGESANHPKSFIKKPRSCFLLLLTTNQTPRFMGIITDEMTQGEISQRTLLWFSWPNMAS